MRGKARTGLCRRSSVLAIYLLTLYQKKPLSVSTGFIVNLVSDSDETRNVAVSWCHLKFINRNVKITIKLLRIFLNFVYSVTIVQISCFHFFNYTFDSFILKLV